MNEMRTGNQEFNNFFVNFERKLAKATSCKENKVLYQKSSRQLETSNNIKMIDKRSLNKYLIKTNVKFRLKTENEILNENKGVAKSRPLSAYKNMQSNRGKEISNGNFNSNTNGKYFSNLFSKQRTNKTN